MKTYKYLFAAFAATMALASCSKDFIGQNDTSGQSEGTRTIAVSFGPQTRTALDKGDGVTPKFVAGDEIMVANGHAAKVCSVSVDGKGNASFTTDLTGTLMAVYPVGAAKMNGDAIAGVNVSNVQDGTFANANICMAKNITGNEARFVNQTALLCITPAAGDDTQYIEVSAEGFEIANDVPTGATYEGLDKIRVDIPETDKQDKYFVSILAPDGLTVGALTFSDGTNVKTFTGETATAEIAAGSLYTVNNEGWESPAPAADYVEIGGVKWATKNLGAEKETDSGHYFSWGNTDGYVYDSAFSKWVKASDHSVVLENGFSQDEYPETPGGKLTGEISSANDAATAYLGSGWRMPTSTEFQKLYDACYTGSYDTATNPAEASVSVGKGIYWCTGYDGAKGVLFVDESGHKLFFPAASFVTNTTLSTNNGYYWSSTYNNSTFAYHLLFNDSKVEPQNFAMPRYYGFPIRPVYGPAPGSTVEDFNVQSDDSKNW